MMNADAQKIAALKEELRKDLEALERVERLMANKNGGASPINDKQALLELDSEDDDGVGGSLRGTIENTMNSDPEVKWTTQKMLAHLRGIGFPLRAKKPIYSISQAMQKLQEAGRVRLVRRGAGNQPNIYKGKAAEPTTEAPSVTERGGHTEPSRIVQ